MQISLGRKGLAASGFLVGFALCAFGPHLVYWASNSAFVQKFEEQRVTSPDGRYDAVMVVEHFGGFGSDTNWYLYILAKGAPAPWHYAYDAEPVLWASPLSEEKLNWKTPHYLEVHYDIGEIVEFRNLWSWLEAMSWSERTPWAQDWEWVDEYNVEIRLCPSSDYSVLTPEGERRH